MKVALLHPGEMGVTVGSALQHAGHEVLWCKADRSEATAGRARGAGFAGIADLTTIASMADVVISVCPPASAPTTADAVLSAGFAGTYVDANAVSPATARHIAARFGDRYVDGGLIGPPAHQPGTTRLYLSGASAEDAVGWFRGSLLEAIAVGADPSAASALKMCYAAYTKGSAALLLNVRALATAEGVTEALLAEWLRSQPGLADRAEQSAKGTARKAWRFEGEMSEIADTFRDAGLPDGFHRGAADVYRAMAPLKETGGALDEVIDRLIGRVDE